MWNVDFYIRMIPFKFIENLKFHFFNSLASGRCGSKQCFKLEFSLNHPEMLRKFPSLYKLSYFLHAQDKIWLVQPNFWLPGVTGRPLILINTGPGPDVFNCTWGTDPYHWCMYASAGLCVLMFVVPIQISMIFHLNPPVFNPRPLRPKGYCRHLRLSVCPSVCLSVCLFPSSLLTQ